MSTDEETQLAELIGVAKDSMQRVCPRVSGVYWSGGAIESHIGSAKSVKQLVHQLATMAVSYARQARTLLLHGSRRKDTLFVIGTVENGVRVPKAITSDPSAMGYRRDDPSQFFEELKYLG